MLVVFHWPRLPAGAQSSLAVDGSEAALELAMQGAVTSGVVDKFEIQKAMLLRNYQRWQGLAKNLGWLFVIHRLLPRPSPH